MEGGSPWFRRENGGGSLETVVELSSLTSLTVVVVVVAGWVEVSSNSGSVAVQSTFFCCFHSGTLKWTLSY